MLSFHHNDQKLLSRRSRAFIRLNHIAAIGVIGWIAYLWFIREIL